MAMPYVCSTCRQTLARRSRQRMVHQWRITASQSSFAARETINAHDKISAARSSELSDKRSFSGQYDIPEILDDLYTQLSVTNIPRDGRYSRMARKAHSRSPRELESPRAIRRALVEIQGKSTPVKKAAGHRKVILQKDSGIETSLVTGLRRNQDEESVGYQLLRRLSETKPGSPQRLWSFFRRVYPEKDCINLKNPALLDIPKLRNGRLFSMVLNYLSRQWIGSLDNAIPTRPTPPEVVLKFEELRVMRPTFWAESLLLLSMEIVSLNKGASTEQTRSSKLKNILEITMVLWRMCLRTYVRPSSGNSATRSGQTEASSSPQVSNKVNIFKLENPAGTNMSQINRLQMDWFFLPDQRSLNLVARAGTRPDFGSRFFRYLSKYPLRSDFRLSTAALMTFTVLRHWCDTGILTDEEETHISPFTSFLAHLLPYSDMSYELERVKSVLLGIKVTHSTIESVQEMLRDAHTASLTEIGSKTRPDYRKLPYQKTMHKAEKNLETFFVRRMHRCMWKKNADHADKLWKEVQRTFDEDLIDSQKSQIPLSLFNEFMVLFHSIRLPEKAVEVWNYMGLYGVKQTVATWTAMMKGCQLTREYRNCEKIWRQMLDSGIRADEQAWAVRLYTLFHSKQVREGMTALADMTDEWLESQGNAFSEENNIIKFSPKPNTLILNAALSGLTKFHMNQMIRRLLSWAKELKIDYDAVTYNILIRSALSEENNEEATRLLQQMGHQGIEPNIALFSILLDSLFRNSSEMNAMTDDQLAEKILGILSQLDSYGAHGNTYPYTVLIGGLIHVRQNPAVAQTVLNHMASRNIRPSPHVYSSLMTFYFSQNEPDEGAINALWEQIQAGGHADAILYDRMVENYASTGDIGKMMTFLQKMPKEGRSSSWRSLTAAVQALAEAGHWDRFDEMIEGVRDAEETITNIGWIESGQDIFWNEVERLRAGKHSGSFSTTVDDSGAIDM